MEQFCKLYQTYPNFIFILFLISVYLAMPFFELCDDPTNTNKNIRKKHSEYASTPEKFKNLWNFKKHPKHIFALLIAFVPVILYEVIGSSC